MQIFMILVGLGLVFMLYTLVNFFVESERSKGMRRRVSNPKAKEVKSGHLVGQISMRSQKSRSKQTKPR